MFAMVVEETKNVPGRGTVVTGHVNFLKYSIKVGDSVYDITGEKYSVRAIEMIRPKTYVTVSYDNMPFGLIIDTNGKSNEYFPGKLLTSEYETVFLYPADPLDGNAPDPDYKDEYDRAAETGFSAELISLDKLENGGTGVKPKKSQLIRHLIYRGWMISPENYKRLYSALAETDCYLINTPEQYEYCHLLPNWYKELKDITPVTAFSENISDENIISMLKNFGNKPLIVKDYVKSRKHEWNDACFIPDASDTENAMKIIHNFTERQGEDLTGGIVLREYAELRFIGYHPQSGMKLSAEYRAFFFCGRIVGLTDYWGNTDEKYKPDKDEFDRICKIAYKIKSNFFTIDIARKNDGGLIAIELGDGQVSGLQGQSPAKFYERLTEIISDG